MGLFAFAVTALISTDDKKAIGKTPSPITKKVNQSRVSKFEKKFNSHSNEELAKIISSNEYQNDVKIAARNILDARKSREETSLNH